MYSKKCIIVIVLFIFAITNFNVAFASNRSDGDVEMNTGFEVKDYDNSDLEAFSAMLKLKLLVADYNGKIDNFDVNANGSIVVAFKTASTEKMVCVYNSVGEFQYGYSLLDFGTIGVEWDGENVIIYSVRSDYLILLDRYAHILDKKKVLNTLANNTYSHKILWDTQRKVGSDTYKLKTSKIIKIDTDGNKTVIVDKSGAHYFHNTLVFLFIGFVIIWATLAMIKLFQNCRR